MRPRVTIHIMASVDGRLDWLTDNAGIYYELAETFGADAMLSGSDTMLAAYPEPVDTPTDTGEQFSDQRLIVVDSRGRIPNWRRIRSEPWWGDCIAVCSASTPTEYLAYLDEVGVPRVVAGRDRADLGRVLEVLAAEHDVRHVRVDSGGILNGVLLRHGFVDEVSVLLDPRLVGGRSARSMYAAPDLTSIDDVVPLEILGVETLSDGFVWLRYSVRR